MISAYWGLLGRRRGISSALLGALFSTLSQCAQQALRRTGPRNRVRSEHAPRGPAQVHSAREPTALCRKGKQQA
eukprot:383884-Pyramimonas_sp.AAC.1